MTTHHTEDLTKAAGLAISRRSAVAGIGAVALGGAVLAACAPGGEEEEDGGPSEGALATTSDIPVGGGKVFKQQKVVVTQPEAGEFKGYTAICTHQACIVSNVADGDIICNCHGSRFSITDGKVTNGPATQPLPGAKVSVQGDDIVLG